MRDLDRRWYQQLSAAISSPNAETALQNLIYELNGDPDSVELRQLYLSAIKQELARIDLELRTAHGKEYPSREAARAANQSG